MQVLNIPKRPYQRDRRARGGDQRDSDLPALPERDPNRRNHEYDADPVEDEDRSPMGDSHIEETMVNVPAIGRKNGPALQPAPHDRKQRVENGDAECDDGYKQRNRSRFL